jgi:hypothetical protein
MNSLSTYGNILEKYGYLDLLIWNNNICQEKLLLLVANTKFLYSIIWQLPYLSSYEELDKGERVSNIHLNKG